MCPPQCSTGAVRYRQAGRPEPSQVEASFPRDRPEDGGHFDKTFTLPPQKTARLPQFESPMGVKGSTQRRRRTPEMVSSSRASVEASC